MRLFVAVELSEEAREAAGAVSEQLRAGIGRRIAARWVDPGKMHLTVRFIGHLAAGASDAVLDALRAPLPVAAFDVVLGSCGAFPRAGPPRVIWIGLAEGFPALASIHDECNRRLAPLGLEPEARPFSAHLTLARVKDARAPIRRGLADVPVPPARSHVTSATVFESVLSPQGSHYRRLLDVACQG
jgi:2'-5' RNA ligase